MYRKMKQPKQFFAVLLALTLVLSLAACGNSGSINSSGPSSGGNPSESVPSGNDSSESAAPTTGWPNGKDITFDVPSKAGGGTDLLSRYLTTAWASKVDGNFVVTNYDTAEVGSQHSKNAKPDGLTLTTVGCQSMDMYLAGMSEVNPAEDMTVIGKFIAGGPNVIIARVDAPYNNLTELKEYAEAHPNEVITGVGLGSSSHLIWLNIVKAMGGIELNYVQATSEADKLTNIAAGSLDVGNCSLNNAIAYEADGKLKVLGIITYSDDVGKDAYMEGLSDAYLTTAEQGFPGAAWPSGNYVCGPAGMDPALVEEINASLQQIVDDPGFVEGMAAMSQAIDMKGVSESQSDFAAEWELQQEMSTAAGVNVRS